MKVISICLSDLPKEKITTSDKNGKKYISLVVDDRKEADKFGNDVTVYVNPTKEERAAKANKVYVGQGKNFDFNNQQAQTPEKKSVTEHDDSGLPF